MSRMDAYLDNYMIQHNERKYISKIKTRRILIISIIVIALIVIFNPLTKIRNMYIKKFSTYASTHAEYNPFKKNVNSNNQKNDENIAKEIEFNGKYPMPINGVVTSEYNKSHRGIDIQGEHRDNIISIEKGVVTFAGTQNGYGNCIEIRHYDESGNVFYSFYAHLSKINVKLDDEVEMFEIIGQEGGQPGVDVNPGNSTGHHLHFEIRTAPGYGNDIDPTSYIF